MVTAADRFTGFRTYLNPQQDGSVGSYGGGDGSLARGDFLR